MAAESLTEVEVAGLVPTEAGCALFLGAQDKVIMFYIDPATGASINAILADSAPPRPLTHDLFMDTLEAFGAKVREVVISAKDGDVFYSQLVLTAENELMEKQIMQPDSRPSDAIALAVREDAPIFCRTSIWDKLPDVTELLQRVKQEEDTPDLPG